MDSLEKILSVSSKINKALASLPSFIDLVLRPKLSRPPADATARLNLLKVVERYCTIYDPSSLLPPQYPLLVLIISFIFPKNVTIGIRFPSTCRLGFSHSRVGSEGSRSSCQKIGSIPFGRIRSQSFDFSFFFFFFPHLHFHFLHWFEFKWTFFLCLGLSFFLWTPNNRSL